ncbi:hypothetical protein ACFQ88_08295 [Paenibacillus sp. NPDC056579]|uniref:hypothetical protein n=1 Tax=unclassified Paenibacillus TaxID=185978 RepID=UPI001EF82867|nr:hypothetical protein [Paenibacillus sp. H1-7]
MADQRNQTPSKDQQELSTEIAQLSSKEQPSEPGIDYTKDFIWGSDQDEYIDEA